MFNSLINSLIRIFSGRHIPAVLLMAATFIVGLAIYIGVHASRNETLPTLVYSPNSTDAALLAAGPVMLDRLGHGWWWFYADPAQRDQLRLAGARLAVAFPTPLAQMAGCSVPSAPFIGAPL
jgi:hypothetical protein